MSDNWYLRRKEGGYEGEWVFYDYLEEDPTDGSLFMMTGKAKYATEFGSAEEAEAFRDKHDTNGSFVVVNSLKYR